MFLIRPLMSSFLTFFMMGFLSYQMLYAFPGWNEQAVIQTDHPRLSTLDEEGLKDLSLIPAEIYIDPGYQDTVDKSLSDILFGIKTAVIPSTFVVEMKGEPLALESEGLVLLKREQEEKWQVIREFTLRWEYYDLEGMFNRVDKLGSPKIFNDCKVASIATKFSSGYYHFLFDMLPRLRLLKKSGLVYDKLYVSSLNRPYVREALEIAGIPKEKIISSIEHPIITADTLVLPSFPSISYQSSPWVIEWLRDFYLEKSEEVEAPKQLIYISRNDADKRRITNEPRLLEMLEILGFKKAILEGKSVKEQAELFQDAKVVIGPHGAGFSNIIFSQKDATLIELMNPSWPHGPFAALAEKREMKYGLVFGENQNKKTLDYKVSLHKTWLEIKKHVSFSKETEEKIEKYLTRYSSEKKTKKWNKTLDTVKISGITLLFYHVFFFYFQRKKINLTKQF